MLNQVQSIIEEYEEEVLFDVEAPEHWYEIEFCNNNQMIIYEIDEYKFDGEEQGEIETSLINTEVESIPCTLKQFTNFVIQFYQTQLLYMRASYPQEAYILEKVIIRGVKYD